MSEQKNWINPGRYKRENKRQARYETTHINIFTFNSKFCH